MGVDLEVESSRESGLPSGVAGAEASPPRHITPDVIRGTTTHVKILERAHISAHVIDAVLTQ